jgi:hypothetical protein
VSSGVPAVTRPPTGTATSTPAGGPDAAAPARPGAAPAAPAAPDPAELDHTADRCPQRQGVHRGLGEVVRLLGLDPLRRRQRADRGTDSPYAALDGADGRLGGTGGRGVPGLGRLNLGEQGRPQPLVGDLPGGGARGGEGLVRGLVGGPLCRGQPRTAARNASAGPPRRRERLGRPVQVGLRLRRVDDREHLAGAHPVAGTDPQDGQSALGRGRQRRRGPRRHGRRRIDDLGHRGQARTAQRHRRFVVAAGRGGQRDEGDAGEYNAGEPEPPCGGRARRGDATHAAHATRANPPAIGRLTVRGQDATECTYETQSSCSWLQGTPKNR